MQRCETVTFSRDNYKSDIEFWSDIQAVVRALAKNQYQMVCRSEECCDSTIFTIEFNYDCGYGNADAHWVTEDEYLLVLEDMKEKIKKPEELE